MEFADSQRAAKQYRRKGTLVFVPGNHQGPLKNHHRPSVGTLVPFCYLSAFSIVFKCKGGELLQLFIIESGWRVINSSHVF